MDTALTTNASAEPFDVDKYRHFIRHLGLPHARETEMIQTLRVFLGGHVDRAFGHDPIQLTLGDRLQLSDERPSPAMVGSWSVPETPSDLSGSFAAAHDPDQRKR